MSCVFKQDKHNIYSINTASEEKHNDKKITDTARLSGSTWKDSL